MFNYYIKLAFNSFKRNPILTGLMITAIALRLTTGCSKGEGSDPILFGHSHNCLKMTYKLVYLAES